MTNYRSCNSYPNWGICDGNNSYDGNQEANGYPCLDQIGRSTNQTAAPMRAGYNLLNDKPNNISLTNSCQRQDLHIVENRDFTNGVEMDGYTPYTYPHPLAQIEDPPKAPKELRIIEDN